MTKIESKRVAVSASPEKVSAFLTNTDNIQKLLPEGKYSDWKSDGTVCSFKIQGAYTIGLRIKEIISNTNVIYESTEGSPFAFTLNTHISPTETGSEAYLLCDAQLNPFLEMIVKGPLKSLFDYMADRCTTAIQ
jgi:carbon monoxide dehydrogenase subunit G